MRARVEASSAGLIGRSRFLFLESPWSSHPCRYRSDSRRHRLFIFGFVLRPSSDCISSSSLSSSLVFLSVFHFNHGPLPCFFAACSSEQRHFDLRSRVRFSDPNRSSRPLDLPEASKPNGTRHLRLRTRQTLQSLAFPSHRRACADDDVSGTLCSIRL
jgi:hypothetical protein